MRKRRGFIIGLGLGLMLGAAMLQLMLAADASRLPGAPLTGEALKKEAAAQGFALVPAEEKTYTQQELDRAVAEAVRKAAASGGGGAAQKGGGTGAPAPADSASPAKASASSQKPAAEKYAFYIRANATLAEVATGLKELGLIEDEEAFIRKAKPYSGKLRVGPSVFEGKPSFDRIIAEITRAKY